MYKWRSNPGLFLLFGVITIAEAELSNHDVQAVAVQGTHPAYKLGQADLTCSSLSELSVYNIRRLFATRGSDFMDKKKAFVASRGVPPKGGDPRWRVANGTVEPG